jgi:NOL1/NOP2/fmu family ribosome biogenesis protein
MVAGGNSILLEETAERFGLAMETAFKKRIRSAPHQLIICIETCVQNRTNAIKLQHGNLIGWLNGRLCLLWLASSYPLSEYYRVGLYSKVSEPSCYN